MIAVGRSMLRARPEGSTRSRVLTWIVALSLVTLWCAAVSFIWRTRGLFDWLGIDYGFFWAAAQVYRHGGPLAIFDLGAIADAVQPLAAYYGAHADALKVGPTPYPLLVLLFAPYTMLPPPVGFAIWTAINLAVAFSVAYGLASRFRDGAVGRALIALSFFPVAYTLFVGQPTILLLYAFYRAYCALERGSDFSGGLWCGSLLFKPQYAAFLGLVLLYKRRWRALAGMAVTGAAIAGAYVAMLGVDGVRAYVTSLGYASGFRSVDPIVYPEQMISWRGFLALILPATVTEQQGMLVAGVLSVLTAASLFVIWRGPWTTFGGRFASRMLATMLVTMLASFHNHAHGAALLLVPGMALAAQGGGPRLVQPLLRIALFLPNVLFALTFSMPIVALVFVVLMTLALSAIFLETIVGTQPFLHHPSTTRPRTHGIVWAMGQRRPE